MKTIYDAIDYIRNEATSEKDKGTRFERLSRYYLKNDPLWKSRFANVWLWSNSPTNDGVDIGIDLVALDSEDNSYWAIQCKCWDDDATLDYKEVATFYGKTGNGEKYAHTMIITSAGRFSSHLDTIARNWDTVRIFTEDIAESDIDFEPWIEGKNVTKRAFQEPLEHQKIAIKDCLKGFKEHDRGQLIMACGTGKTLTALRLTEQILKDDGDKGGRVLFLAPSIALVGQSMRYWANQSKNPLACAVVCSDAKASNTDVDIWESSLSDLPYPASTAPEQLYEQMLKADDNNELVVIFSTYQSIQVVADAQKMGLPPFDIIICDEAHRTTGSAALGASKKELSEYIKVHDNSIINAKRRLYMTATPRLYGDRVKQVAKADSYIVSSMDDIEIYGPEFHRLSFGRAVDEKLLTDYKVIALTMPEDVVSAVYQRAMTAEGKEFDITESARIIGCWKGLLNQGEEDGIQLKNAVAFCSTIAESKKISEYFQETVNHYIDYEKEQGIDLPEFRCKIEHVDGTMDAKIRKDRIKWLEEIESGDGAACRILSNARCLAEGVDVPNLDAVLFLQPKKSQIDITQAVGRVMRKFEGKEYGYIILPIVIPAGMTAEEALDDNETYAVVWDILKALRSHDERLDAKINAIPYDKNKSQSIINVVDASGIPPKPEEKPEMTEEERLRKEGIQTKMDLSQTQLQEAVNALIVKKCGTKVYWDVWAKDIAKIAKRHIARIEEIVAEDSNANKAFNKFLRGLRDSLNNSITEDQAVEMLAQHIITLPVFEALFGGANFANSNPVSIAMEQMLSELRKHTLETEDEKRELDDLYASVRLRAAGIRTDAGKQAVIKDLYEQFFREAFKATSEKMGIVYTPNQVVDYILHATDRLLYQEFGEHLYDTGVHILDAFTGTGTFIVDLINDEELMPDDQLKYKYENEIHCNEIMLLAYYIATINIEHAYHNRLKNEEYKGFSGAVLTDTFQMYEEGDAIDSGMFLKNTIRALNQKDTPIHVLVGNPPWSIGQASANDNNANENYPTLDRRIEETYAEANESAGLLKGLYDSYIRAFRWASDRIGDRGIISFVTNGGWLRSGSGSGFRKCLANEFNSIYVFDLRGNARTQGEERRKEKDNVFGQGTRTPVAITLLVKNPKSNDRGKIYYHDIGDYLTREEKLSIVASSIINEPFEWDMVIPDRFGDWFDQRNNDFNKYAPVALKKWKEPYGIFMTYSMGVATNRDAWTYSFSRQALQNNIAKCINFYNNELDRWKKSSKTEKIEDFLIRDSKEISWTRGLRNRLYKEIPCKLKKKAITTSLYRPFCKQWLYYDEEMIEMPLLQPRIMPKNGGKNLQIIVSGIGHIKPFSCLITNTVPCLDAVEKGQCFPLYYYDGRDRQESISDDALVMFRKIYPAGFTRRLMKDGGPEISTEDVFYYIYGILHSPEYRERFSSNLKKELPRIPLATDFTTFSLQGRALAELHLNYENVDKYPLKILGDIKQPGPVEKMRWGKKKDPDTGKSIDDKTTLVYNANLTFKDIPEVANEYVVNGRSPLEWMIDRYRVTIDKDSGLINNPNEYSDNPNYIVDLIQRLVTVSVKTMEIINAMPPIQELPQPDFWPEEWKVKDED